MQVSAMKPMGLNEESIDAKILNDEKDIILKQIENILNIKKIKLLRENLISFSKRIH